MGKYPMAGQVGLRLEVENYGGNNKRVQSRGRGRRCGVCWEMRHAT